MTEHGYSVVLPEKLDTGKWNVYRWAYSLFFVCAAPTRSMAILSIHVRKIFLFCCGDRSAHSPLKLASRFPDHPEIGTMHDNFV